MFDAFDSDSRRCRCRLRNNRFDNGTVKVSKDNERADELQNDLEPLRTPESMALGPFCSHILQDIKHSCFPEILQGLEKLQNVSFTNVQKP
ncbi:hypothetical protein Aduo_017939 [Ancylostoma duodenale]